MPALRIITLALLCAVWTALPVAHAQDAESSYKQAAGKFLQTRNNRGATPQAWRAVAAEFQRVHDMAPRQSRGADALFSVGLSLREAFRSGGTPEDLSGAQAAFERFAAEFPRHPLADDSLMHVADILEQDRRDASAAIATYRKVADAYPDGDLRDLAQQRLKALRAVTPAATAPSKPRPEMKPVPAAPAPEPLKPAPAKKSPTEPVILKRMQVLSALQFTRIILTTSGPVNFRHDMAPDGKGNAVTVLLDGVKAGSELELPIPTKDSLVKQVNVGENGGNGVAVRFAALPLKTHDVKEFNLPTETKLVVDLYPRAAAASAPPRAQAKRVPRGPAATIPAEQLQASLRTSLGLKVRSIMLDPGHGGHDPGAIADGLEEKAVALAIARELRDILLKHHPELRVGMTRDGDAFIPLTRRPELAKAFGADLFVSIHLNANPITRFQGVETYFLNLSSDASAIAVAARENATSEKRVSDLNGILLDLLRDTNILESSKLAAALHSSLVEQLRDTRPVRDLGVKQAPFMVLIGAEMPSVLVEAGFLTNPEEASQLKQQSYLRSIAEGIYSGLEKYIEDQDIARSRSVNAVDRLVSQRSSP